MVETFGSGVAWIDYDDDGFQDLFFVNGAPGSSNALYHNNRDGTFTDVTARAGVAGNEAATRPYKTGVAVGDFDNDGYLDLYVTAFGPNTLYRNNHDGTFSDVTSAAGVAGPPTEWSTSTGFIDVDRDGFLDLYVVNYLDYRLSRQSVLRTGQSRISDVLPPDDVRRDGGSAVPQQRQRHVHRHLEAGRHRQSGRQGPRRGVLRLRSRRPDRHLRRQRHRAQFSLPQHRQGHLRRRGLSRRRRVRRQRQAAGGHGHRLRRRRRGRAAGHLRHQFLGGAEHALPEPGRRHLRRRHGQGRAWGPGFCRWDSGPRCSTPTTTATSTST